jgi:hypothetical protein
MKTRHGFVSNSSSSSYIIAIKGVFTPCPTCGRSGGDFLKSIESEENYNDNNKVCGVGAEHVIWELSNDEWMTSDPKLIKNVEEYLGNKDWTVARIRLSYHNEKLKNELNRLIDEGNVRIIKNEND